MSQYVGLSVGGEDESTKQFERGGFSGSVGSEKGDHFATFDLEVDSIDGVDRLVFSVKQPTDRGEQSFAFPEDSIGLRQVTDVDGGHAVSLLAVGLPADEVGLLELADVIDGDLQHFVAVVVIAEDGRCFWQILVIRVGLVGIVLFVVCDFFTDRSFVE